MKAEDSVSVSVSAVSVAAVAAATGEEALATMEQALLSQISVRMSPRMSILYIGFQISPLQKCASLN